MYEIEKEKQKELFAWSKNDKGAFQWGEARLELVSDMANMTMRPEFLLAIEALKKHGYETIEDLQKAIKDKRFAPFVDDELGLSIRLEKEPEKGQIYIPLFKSINVYEIVGYVLGSAVVQKAYTDTKVQMERLKQYKGITGNPDVMFIVLLLVGIGVLLAILKSVRII